MQQTLASLGLSNLNPGGFAGEWAGSGKAQPVVSPIDGAKLAEVANVTPAEFEAVLGTLTRQLEELELNGKYYGQRVEQLAVEPEEVREAEAGARRVSARVEDALQRAAAARAQVRDRDG